MARVRPSDVLRTLTGVEYETNLESSIQTYEYLADGLADTTVKEGEFFCAVNFSAGRMSGPILFEWVASGSGPDFHAHDSLPLVAQLKPPVNINYYMFSTDADARSYADSNPDRILDINREVASTPSVYSDFVNQVYRVAGNFGLEDSTFDGMFTFTRPTISTRINHLKQVDTRSIDEPIFEYDYDSGEALGLLIEGSHTNLLLQSSVITSASWFKNFSGTGSAPVVTANFTTAPDGTTTADRVVFDLNGGTTSGDTSNLGQNVAGTIGERREVTVWLKSNTTSSYTMRLDLSGAASDIPGTTSDITVTPEWQKFRIGLLSLDSTVRHPKLLLRGDLTSQTADISVWGFNMYDQWTGPTTDIETTTSTVTRSADSCSLTTGSNYMLENEGTIYLSFVLPEAAVTGDNRFLRIHDGVSGNRIDVIQPAPGTRVTVGSTSAAASPAFISVYGFVAGDLIKIAISYDKSSVRLFINGVGYDVNPLADFNAVMQGIDIGKVGGSTANTPIKKFIYYPTRLSDDDMRGLTS